MSSDNFSDCKISDTVQEKGYPWQGPKEPCWTHICTKCKTVIVSGAYFRERISTLFVGDGSYSSTLFIKCESCDGAPLSRVLGLRSRLLLKWRRRQRSITRSYNPIPQLGPYR